MKTKIIDKKTFSEKDSDATKKVGIDEFSERVAKKAEITPERSKEYVHTLFDLISAGLKKEDKVSIYKFGNFKKKWVKTKSGINPKTQEKIKIAAHNQVKFSPSSALADEVNKKYRNLKPNVLDEILTLTGIKKISPDIQNNIQKDKVLHNNYQIAKKRALISVIGITIFLILIIFSLIFIPVYFVNENNKTVLFVKNINKMFGLNNISDRFVKKQKEIIDEKKGEEFITDAKVNLIENRKVIKEYIVKNGDSIFGIAENFWQNQYLWPDLYILNKSSVSDPDLIYPDDKLLIYEKLGDPEKFNKKQKEKIVEAFIGVYRIYRAFGEKDIEAGNTKKGEKRIYDARKTLNIAIRYDKDLLNRYKDAIYPDDIAEIKKWQKESEK
ncbi:MAG TPA: HU family DNA-binding protein [Spirochaetota bacterium]|nr:HU family DNA-binding protein [Spirochaetota bacterium]